MICATQHPHLVGAVTDCWELAEVVFTVIAMKVCWGKQNSWGLEDRSPKWGSGSKRWGGSGALLSEAADFTVIICIVLVIRQYQRAEC